MSLAKLFYLKETFRESMRRWRQACFRQRSNSSPVTHHASRLTSLASRFTLETLEPRLLLSATPTEVIATQALEPAAITVPAGSLPSLDVDLNGQADALSDGILIIRHLFGFTGTSLTNGAVDPAGQRTDPTAIATYLDSIRMTALDVDLNQQADALSDGIMIIRSLFGFTGTALTSGAIDPGGQRTDPAVIAAFLDNMNPQREVIAPLITSGLQQDTGISATDAITFNPTITGTIADINQIALFTAGFDAATVGSFVNVLTDLLPTGTFTLSTARLNQLAGGTLADGTHTLHLRATDARGNVATLDRTFTLDTLAPTGNVGLAPVSDTGVIGDRLTTADIVTLTGQTDPFTTVTVSGSGATVTADASGAYFLSGLALVEGTNQVSVILTDQAGNQGNKVQTITRQGADGSILLKENSAWVVDVTTPVELATAAGTRTLRLTLDPLFDTTDTTAVAEDTFLISLVNPADLTDTLLDRGQNGTALFALHGTTAEFQAGLVTFDGTEVIIDLTGLGAQTTGLLRLQLLNHDSDSGSQIRVRTMTNTVNPAGISPALVSQTTTLVARGGAVDLGLYSQTGTAHVDVENVRIDPTTGRYTAELLLHNIGTAIGRQAVVLFPTLPAGVTLRNPSGVDAQGRPYLNLAPALPSGGLGQMTMSASVLVEFDNPTFTQFALTAQVLVGPANRPPVLSPVAPLTVFPGGHLEVPFSATDPDGDRVQFFVTSAAPLPTSMLTGNGTFIVTPAPGEEGTYVFTVMASDGVLTSTQVVTLTVAPDPTATTRISGTVLGTTGEPLAGVPIEIGRIITLTDAQGRFTIELPAILVPTESLNVTIPTGDIYFDPFSTGTQFISMRRAGSDPSTGTSISNPLEHPNLVTSFLDGNIVYGSDPARALALRTLQGGTLKTSVGNLLPFNNTTFFPNGPLENDNAGNADPGSLFVAGDVRASENVALEAMHTVLLREHNRLATVIAAANPGFTDEQIYQEARRWLIGELQHIVYSEYLPVLLGPNAVPAYTGYSVSADPAVSALFATAAFRFGHSQMVSQLLQLDAAGNPLPGGPLNLRDAFFTTAPITANGIDPILRGLLAQQAQDIDTHVVDELRNFLFGPPGSGGQDLVSLNIQRGRDMGLPSYTQARLDFGLSAITSFSQITSNTTVQQMLQSVYGTVDKIDVWVGGIAEDHVAGALIGPLFQKIIADQFARTRNADRFWYENGQFTASELTQLRSTTFADLLARNTGLTNLPASVFTTNAPPTGPAAAGTAAATAPTEFRSADGSGNNLTDPTLGQTGSDLKTNFTVSYGDGISTPGGADRPGAREISNAVFPQTGSIPNTQGATALAVFFGQILDHDLSLTATGITDTIKIHGDQANPAGIYPFVAEKLPLMLGHQVYAGLNNVIARPIFLPAIDLANAHQVSATQDTRVDTAAIPGAVVNIAAGTLQDRSGNPFTGLLSITRVPSSLTPASLPANLNPDLVVTIQPADMVLSTPAPLSLPNSGGNMPGDILDLWSINPLTGQFDLVGKGQVSEDGTVIETIQGGIRNSSWHFFAALLELLDPPETQENSCSTCQATIHGNSEVELYSGADLESHELVSYQSQGVARGITLSYDSLRADPRPIVKIGADNVRVGDNRYLTGRLVIEDSRSGVIVPGLTMPGGSDASWHFWKIPNFPIQQGFNVAFGSVDAAIQADLTQMPTGLYTYQATYGVQNYRPAEVVGTAQLAERFVGTTSTFTGELVSVNEINSPFGAGWGLAGLQKAVRTQDGSILLVDGSGSQLLFRAETRDASGAVLSFRAPAGHFSTLEPLAGGGYRHVFTDQSIDIFDAGGRLTSARDRVGNETRYEYDVSGHLLRIIDPVGLATTFTYTGGHVTAITDPAGRVTRMEYDAAGNLTRIIDPDNTFRTWTYDSQHHMVTEVDKLGNREETFYDATGRVTGVLRKDGSVLHIMPAEIQALLNPDLPDWRTAPEAKLERQAESIVVAPNGNVIRTILDRAGQTVLSFDSIGQLPGVERNADNLVVRTTDANGNSTDFTYDAKGNLLNRKDSLSGGNRVTATISQAGEQDLYRFTLNEEAQLYFDSLTNSSSFTWSLTGPTGALVSNRSFAGSDGASIVASPVLRAIAGDYTLTVDAIGNATGTYDFRMTDLKNAEPVSVNTVVTASLDQGNETDLYTFQAVAGDKLFFDRQGSTAFVNAAWRLIDPFGGQVFGPTNLSDIDTLILDQSGTYTLLIEGAVTNATPIAYTFTVYDASGDTAPLALNATIAGAIDVPGEQDRYTFTLSQATQLYFDAVTNSSSFTWTLTGPRGTEVTNRGFLSGDLLLGPLLAGSYTLTIDGSVATTGTYGFRLVDLASATSITPGTPVSGTLESEVGSVARGISTAPLTYPSGTPNRAMTFTGQGEHITVADAAALRPAALTVEAWVNPDLTSGSFDPVLMKTSSSVWADGYGLHIDASGTQISFFVNNWSSGNIAAALTKGSWSHVAGTYDGATLKLYVNGVLAASRAYATPITHSTAPLWIGLGPGGFAWAGGVDDVRLWNVARSAAQIAASFGQPLASGEAGLVGYWLLDEASGPAVADASGQGHPGIAALGRATDLYRFTAAAGDRFYFDQQALSGQSITPTWRLLNPYGVVVFTQSFNSDVDVQTLGQTGTYTLLVEASISDTAGIVPSYTFNVQPVTDDQTPLIVNQTTSGTIDHAGQQDLYTFTLNNPTTLYFDSLTNNSSLSWSLTGPQGLAVPSRNFTQSDGFSIGGTYQAVPAGTYTLTVDATGDLTGPYSFRLWDLAGASALTPGTAVSGTLNPANETDLYRFTVAAGARVFVDVQAVSGTTPVWRLLDPYGAPVFGPSFANADVDVTTLTSGGTYTLLVEGAISTATATNYTFNVQPVTDDLTALTLNQTTSGTIDHVGQRDLYTFTLSSPATIYFDSLTNNSGLSWSLTGPQGLAVPSRNFTQSDGFSISGTYQAVPTGTYVLTVDATGDLTGPYSFRLWDLAGAPALTLGTAVSGTLNPANETDLYRFTVAAGARVFVDVQAVSGTTPVWRLLDPYGAPVFGPSFANADVDVTTLTSGGTYTLLVEGAITATTATNYTFNVQPVTDDLAALILNGTTSGTIGHVGQRDFYTFTLAQASLLYFDALTNDNRLNWSLTGPRGTEVSARLFTSSDSFGLSGSPALDLPAGAYVLTIDAAGDFTGAYDVRLVDLASVATVAQGAVVSGGLTPPNETDLYRFSAAAGDQLFFDVQAASDSGNSFVRLLGPHGNVIFTRSNLTDQPTVTLPVAGFYTLMIEGWIANTGTDTYTFSLTSQGNIPPPPLTGTALTLGATTTGSLGVVGEQDKFIFTVASPTMVVFDALTSSPAFNWSLNGPGGALITNRSFTATDSAEFANNPALRLAPGGYTLTIAGSSTGTYNFRLDDLAGAASLTPGTPVSGTLNPGNETDLYRFTAQAGDRFYFDAQALTGGSFGLYWRLIDPYGTEVFGPTLFTSDIDAMTLTVSGAYTLLVEGRVFETTPMTYTLNVQPVTDDQTPLIVNQTTSGTIGHVGQRDLYTFTLNSPTILYFDSLTNNSGLSWSLAGPRGTEVLNRNFTQSDGFSISGTWWTAVAGTYTLTVDATGDLTGPYSFRLWDQAGAPALTPGAAVSGTLSPANETDLYRFTVAAGARVFFDVQAVGGTTPVWRLLDPYGTQVFGPSSMADVDVTTLTSGGTYTLLVEGAISSTTVATYQFNVQPVTDDQTPLVLNQTTSGTIDHVGQRDLYTFTLNNPTTLYFDSLTSNSSLSWSLTGPQGLAVPSRNFTQSDGFSINGTYQAVPAGTYTLTVDAAGDLTGPYSFRLWDLAGAPALTPGTAVNGTLNPANEADLYRFTAQAGDRFFFDVQAVTGTTPSWRLLDPYGVPVFGPSSMADVDVTTVTSGGTYTLVVEGAISSTTAATYQFNVQRVTDDQTPLVLNQTTSGTIDHVGQRDLYTFTLNNPTTLYFDSLTNNGSFNWSLTGPRGVEVSNRTFTQSDGINSGGIWPTMPAGTYTLTVNATGDLTGPYSFRLWDLAAAPALTPGTAVSGTLSPANETDLYRFTAQAGNRMFFDVQAVTGTTPSWRLVDPYGKQVFGPSTMSDIDVTTLTSSGVYTLLLEGTGTAITSTNYTFNVQPVTDDQTPLILNQTTSGTIDHVGQRDLYTFTLSSPTYVYFDSLTNNSGLSWSLVGPRGVEVPSRSFTQSDGFSITGTYTLVPAGTYVLTVDATGDQTGPYSFRLWDLAKVPTLTPGTVVSGTVNPANEADLYRFTAQAGDRFFFDLQAVSGTTPVWHLIDPYGVKVFGPSTMADIDVTTLTSGGTYVLVVEGSIATATAATYQFNVQPVMNSTQSVTPNLRTSGVISVAGEQDQFTFNGAVGQRFYFDGLDLDASKINVKLLAPSGTQVWSLVSGINPNVAPFTLQETGTYQLLFDGAGANVGSYSFRLLDLSAARPTTMGTVKSGQLTPLSETDLYAFDGIGGASVVLDRLASSSSFANWRLFGLTNQVLASGTIATDLSAVLPATGRYVIAIEGNGAVAGIPLDYQFQVTTPLDTPVAVSGLGSVLTGTIAAGQVFTTTFTAPQGRLIYLESQDRDLDAINVELRDPNNVVVYTGSASSHSGPLAIPRSGQYTVTIKGTTVSSVGDYRLRIVDLATEAVTLPLGTSVTGSMPFGTGTNIYRITGTAGQRLLYDGLDNSDTDSVTAKLLAPSGATVFSTTDRLNAGPFTLTETGTYYLLLEATQIAAADFTFALLDLATATQVVPGLAMNGTLTTGFKTDLYQFVGAPGQHTFFDGLSTHGSADGSWTLYGPQNQSLGGSASSLVQNDFEVLLPQAGLYTLVVAGNRAVTTATPYSFRVTNATTVVNSSFTPVGDTSATGNGLVLTYDPIFSQVTSVTDELGLVTLFDIDPLNGNTRSITRVVGMPGGADDVTAQFTYTAQGLVDLVTDPLGRITDYDYDLLGRLTRVTLAEGTVDQGQQQFEYDLAGNLTAAIDENSHRTEFLYDVMDRLTLVRDALGFETRLAYDQAGNLIRTTDARTNQTLYAYDVFNRLTRMTDANGGLTRYAYDVNDNLVSLTDPLGHATTYDYDLRDRLTKSLDQAGGVTRFAYDANNNLTSLIDSVGNATFWAYDARDRVSVETDPLGKSTRYQYDASNNVIGMVDRNGQAMTYAYDDLDRLITETWVGSGNVVTSQYDKVGNLTGILDQFSTLTFTYDNRDRVKTVDNQGTPNVPRVALSYVYDGAGNILEVDDTINGTAAGVTAYNYDARNSMTRVTQSGNGVTAKRVDFSYNAIGQFASLDRYADLAGTSLVANTAYSYDALNRLTNMTHRNAANSLLNQFQIEYDPASRITKITDIDGPTDYNYDVRDELTGATHADAANPDETYQYDANGNRIASSLHGTGYVTGPGNRLQSDGTYDYVYDGKGSLIRRTEIATGQVREFDWDQRGRLVEIDDLSGAGQAATQTVKFTYDAFNRRISKTVDADGAGPGGERTTHFVYDRGDVLLDFVDADGSGTGASSTLVERYLQGPAVDQILAQEDAAGNVFWMLTDHLGTVRDLVNNGGVVANHLTYDSYGNVISETDPSVDTRYQFTGREFDEEIASHYYRARYYDSDTGRFISEDMIGFSGGGNFYMYAESNPIAYIDPSGLLNVVRGGVGLVKTGVGTSNVAQGVTAFIVGTAAGPFAPVFWTVGVLKIGIGTAGMYSGVGLVREAINEPSSAASWWNLLGFIPFMGKYDDRRPTNDAAETDPYGPFGSLNQCTPFGVNNPSTPFGPNNPNTPFGNANPSTPFGPNNPNTPFGDANPNTPFGPNNPNTPFGPNNPRPIQTIIPWND